MVLIKKNSILKKIPDEINQKQAQYFDAIRINCEIIDSSFKKLNSILKNILNQKICKPNHSLPLLYAWTIVDCSHRLRELMKRIPKLSSNKFQPKKNFLDETQSIEPFRHFIQHLDKEIENRIHSTNQIHPPFGSISFLGKVSDSENEYCHISVISGLLKNMDQAINLIKISNDMFDSEQIVSNISLNFYNEQVSLSELYISINKFIKALEQFLEKFISKNLTKNYQFSGADILIGLSLTTEK